jgi:hypothetical protein
MDKSTDEHKVKRLSFNGPDEYYEIVFDDNYNSLTLGSYNSINLEDKDEEDKLKKKIDFSTDEVKESEYIKTYLKNYIK